MKYLIAILFVTGSAFAQQYEMGADIGYGIYRDGTIYSDEGSAQAGIRNRFAAGIVLGDNVSQYVEAELDWLYHDGHPFLQAPGVKEHIIAGPAPFPQPIPQIASLTTNDVWKVVFDVGGGVKYRLIPHMLLRAEFVDYLTTFPRQEIVPAPHNTARGIFEQFTPLFGISYDWGGH